MKKLVVLAAGLALLGLGAKRAFAASGDLRPGFAIENGDTNGDHERDLSDGVYLLSYIFARGPAPVPLALCAGARPLVASGDVNGDGEIDIADAVYFLSYLFARGLAPWVPCDQGSPASSVRVVPREAEPFGQKFGFYAGDP